MSELFYKRQTEIEMQLSGARLVLEPATCRFYRPRCPACQGSSLDYEVGDAVDFLVDVTKDELQQWLNGCLKQFLPDEEREEK